MRSVQVTNKLKHVQLNPHSPVLAAKVLLPGKRDSEDKRGRLAWASLGFATGSWQSDQHQDLSITSAKVKLQIQLRLNELQFQKHLLIDSYRLLGNFLASCPRVMPEVAARHLLGVQAPENQE